MELINEIEKETELLMGKYEAYILFMLSKKTQKIEGDLAEVGVYRGGSAKLLCKTKGEKSLYLFDTFEGLPEVVSVDIESSKGEYNANFEEVKNYLKKYKNVYIYRGLFPGTSKPIKNKVFSFVHLDVDIYRSTLDGLKFFYPRMNKGGIILSHDISAPGVKKAFDEFFKDKPEYVIELSRAQGFIVKL